MGRRFRKIPLGLAWVVVGVLVTGCGAISATPRAVSAPCVQVSGYSLGASGFANTPQGYVGGAHPDGLPSVWEPDVQSGGPLMLLATSGYGGLWRLQGVTLTPWPQGNLKTALRLDARVFGCLEPGGHFRILKATSIYTAPPTILEHQLDDVSAGVELVTPQPVQPGGDLLVLIQRYTYADVVNAGPLANNQGFHAMHWWAESLGQPVQPMTPLSLVQHGQDGSWSTYLFSVPKGLAPGWYEVIVAQTATPGNVEVDGNLTFEVGP